MKNLIPLNILIAALLSSPPSYAQSYKNAKDGDNLMNQTTRVEQTNRYTAKDDALPQTNSTTTESATYMPDESSESIYADFTGLYVGADVGYDFAGDIEGMNAGPFVGYGYEFDIYDTTIYAGLEAGYEWSDGDDETGGVEFEKNHAWMASFRPGLKMSEDILGYGIVGYSRAEYESGGDDKYFDGIVMGLGGQINTNTVFKPRLEYTYTNYEEKNIGNLSLDPEEHDIKLGAVFQF